jgi:5-(carboxyamino)imidazole ribonucleotide synthase
MASPHFPDALKPGATIGILGGGQLGRMLAMAAAQLGFHTHVFSPDTESPAVDVASYWTKAGYDDFEALEKFAANVDLVTYEFENVPVAAVRHVASMRALFPCAEALDIAQDRLTEKNYATSLGIRTAPFTDITHLADLESAVQTIGVPALLKTRRMGYDGKGQVRIDNAAEAAAAWQEIGGQPAILEGMVNFSHEISVIIVRNHAGVTGHFGPIENVHRQGILATSTIPSQTDAENAAAAIAFATRLAHDLAYAGVLTVEFFVDAHGIVFNEMAPRVHNSGHWTIEGAVTSQFENHIRAIAGLPLGDCTARGTVRMQNLIGNDVHSIPALLAQPTAHVHHYGKKHAHPGRKMGHVTWVTES